MSRSTVMVEIDPKTQKIVRIFRHMKKALSFDPDIVRSYPRSDAKKAIRDQIWVRCGGNEDYSGRGTCEYGCGRTFKYSGTIYERMNMHEEIPRSPVRGGEYSLTNSKGVCYTCHFNDERGHANRRLRWSSGTTMPAVPE